MPTSSPRFRFFFVLVLLAATPAWIGGCTSDDVLVPPDDPPDPGSVDFDRLFAPPTEAEVQIVRAEWQERSYNRAYDPGTIAIEYEGDLLGDGSTVAILSHTVGGASFTHYGAVRFPPGETPGGGWPVTVFTHGGFDGFDLAEALEQFATGSFKEIGSQSAVVMPTFRSETMANTPRGDLVSGGATSIWDRDVDDALALLDATLQTFSDRTDAHSFTTIGTSRGGAVALLLATRDERVEAVVDYFGPTDFFGPATRRIAEGTDTDSTETYGSSVTYLQDLTVSALAEGTISYDAARLELLKRSAAYFADRLPNTIAHHHECDSSIPFEHFAALQARENKIAGSSELYDYDEACPDGEPDRRFHSLDESVMPGNTERTTTFLNQYFR